MNQRPAIASPRVERLVDLVHDGQGLCSYARALDRMQALVARSPNAPDVLLVVQHPPTITLGRRGGRHNIHSTTLALADHPPVEVDVHEVARGGDVTYHAPGQLVIYPIVQLPRWTGDTERFPHGDLPRFVRALEAVMQQTCDVIGLPTVTRKGFSGLWIDETTKIASIGIGVRNGWSFHGLALNVRTRLEGFELITACGLGGVQMSSVWAQLQQRQQPTPDWETVEQSLIDGLCAAISAGARPAAAS